MLDRDESVEAARFLAAYDTIELNAAERDRLPIEAFCLAAKIPTMRMFGVIAEACGKFSNDAANLIASVHHPEVVKATVASALHPLGKEDRKMLHLHSGFVPVPKNQTVFNQFSPGAQQNNTQNNDNRNQKFIEGNQEKYNPNEINNIDTKLAKITDGYNKRMGIKEEAGEVGEVSEAASEPASEPAREAVEPVMDAEVLESNEEWS